MTRRRRKRRVLKWAGTAACLACVALIVVGFGHNTSAVGGRGFAVSLVCNNLIFIWGPKTSWRSLANLKWSRSVYLDSPFAFFLFTPPPLPPLRSVQVPLLPLLSVLAVPTGLLWWADRGYPRGRCQACGYNLAGNVSGRCPECGELLEVARGGL